MENIFNESTLIPAKASEIEWRTEENKAFALSREAAGDRFGAIEMTVQRDTRRVPCFINADGTVSTYGWMTGLTGRYRTGMKAWPVTVRQIKLESGIHEQVWFGRDDRCGQKKSILCWSK